MGAGEWGTLYKALWVLGQGRKPPFKNQSIYQQHHGQFRVTYYPNMSLEAHTQNMQTPDWKAPVGQQVQTHNPLNVKQ